MDKLSEGDRKIAENALNAAKGKRFFHWELEFPEVFYGKGREKENPGFDVVVGNPPYVRIQTTSKDEIQYFSGVFESAISNYDIYVLFVECGTHLFNKQGNLGFILPKKFFTATYGEGLRNVISKLPSVS